MNAGGNLFSMNVVWEVGHYVKKMKLKK